MNVITPIHSPDEMTWPEEDKQPLVEIPRTSAPGLDSLLRWGYEMGVSRIAFQTDKPVSMRLHGHNFFATKKALDQKAMAEILNHIHGQDASARLDNGKDFDTSYSIRIDRKARIRFRINATPTTLETANGAHLVIRPIPDTPPSLEEQGVEDDIIQAIYPENGMIIVGGATGSGKTTLIAGLLLHKLKHPSGNYNIATGEAPIEYLLESVPTHTTSTINQSEIPENLPSFQAFIRGCMRRELTDIVVGECRDGETMDAAINAAMAGNTLTTTIHANNVPLMIQRMVALCPEQGRNNLLTAMIQSLRFMVNQKLVFSTDGKRTALREYLIIDDDLRFSLLRSSPIEWPDLVKKALEERGHSFSKSVTIALNAGRITSQTAQAVIAQINNH